MEQYKQEFIEFMVDSNVLKFGDFTLKSGRKSPFFMNAGAYVTAHSCADWANIMQRRFMTTTDWILTCCLDPHTKAFR